MGLYRATFVLIYYMSEGLTSKISHQNLAKLSGYSRHEWKIVCVKFHENWLRID